MGNLSVDENLELAKGVQILQIVNHKFELQMESLKKILEDNENILEDYNAVIVSIAGAFRKGKSLLMNFFLKYLKSQYKKRDISDWIGEHNNDEKLDGFYWRGGQNPATMGLCIWPEFFTHEYSNGDKVAIILLDTQGLFDHESSMKDCIATFAISMMLSSVQCFNVMQQVEEADLQHLDMFTGYAQHAMQQIEGKPFQKLLFIVRDWPHPDELNNGHSAEFVEKLFEFKDKQTTEMRALRERIRSSFAEIGAFLIPHPGVRLSTGRCDTLRNIDKEFINYVKELVPSLLAPDKLIVKEVNGEKWRLSDFLSYLAEYVEMFNSEEVPEPQSFLMATAKVNNIALSTNCYKCYVDLMEKCFERKCENRFQPFFHEDQLQETHKDMKLKAMSKFREKRKIGDADMIIEIDRKLEDDIEAKYASFKEKNGRNKTAFDELAKAGLEERVQISLNLYVYEMNDAFDPVESYFSEAKLQIIHEKATQNSVSMISKTSEDHELLPTFKQKLVLAIEEKFTSYREKNNERKANRWKQYVILGTSVATGTVLTGIPLLMRILRR